MDGDLGIPDALHALHTDELVHFFKHRDKVLRKSQSYPYFVARTLKDYVGFLFSTWGGACWNICVLPTTLVDMVSIISFALISTFFLFALMVYCILNKTYTELSTSTNENMASQTTQVLDDIYGELSNEEIAAACDALAEPIALSKNSDTSRRFDLDVAKLLLQCAALMYARTDAPLLAALRTKGPSASPGHKRDKDADTSAPGALLANEIGTPMAQAVCAALRTHPEEVAMRAFAQKYGLEYVTLSEMHSQSSATCGLFYHPQKAFIILAYKGTSPAEFAEWVTDLSFEPQCAGSWIRGFGKVHGGFLSRIFPDHVKRRTRMPYSTIRAAVNICARELLKDKPLGTQINVWTTGHSLGCSLASLVYARQINEPGDLGRGAVVRDAYLFAAPILCDSTSVSAFNNRMRHENTSDGCHPRTMWRVTNGLDVVAVGLPHQGDHPRWGLSAHNIFSFAHLGSEIELRPAPHRCIVRGSHVTAGSEVRVVSRVHKQKAKGSNVDEKAGKVEDECALARAKCRKMQALPLLGRGFAHFATFYWVALTDVATGRCKWDEDP
ncbi:alpha/beta-hydrolase [Auricularia subglabra TFB-10046 SS5]|nr:alpha/beta-hydrolase [Auricularia subglabra TFB-10046 SS5]